MSTRPFKLCTRAMESPRAPGLRREILQRPLSPAQVALFDYPIEQWKTATREDFAAFSCFIPCPKTAADIPRADMADAVFAKIGVYPGPVTNLGLDAIVNAANEMMLGGSGVDGAIHRAAGPLLVRECATHNGCPTGEAVITKGYNLGARYVIHTVGPMGEQPEPLRRCYRSVLTLAVENGLRSVGLCGVSTGVYGYPLRAATRIAVDEVSRFLKDHPSDLDFVCFACFLDDEIQVTSEELKIQRLRLATEEA